MTQFYLRIGDIVLIKKGSPSGSGEFAYVYDTYPDFDDKNELGVCLITESGNDTGGWSKEEQLHFLEPVRYSGFQYHFTSVMNLDQDFRIGTFDKVFHP